MIESDFIDMRLGEWQSACGPEVFEFCKIHLASLEASNYAICAFPDHEPEYKPLESAGEIFGVPSEYGERREFAGVEFPAESFVLLRSPTPNEAKMFYELSARGVNYAAKTYPSNDLFGFPDYRFPLDKYDSNAASPKPRHFFVHILAEFISAHKNWGIETFKAVSANPDDKFSRHARASWQSVDSKGHYVLIEFYNQFSYYLSKGAPSRMRG